MPDLAQRSFEPEWMDDPAVDEATFRACLADLAAVNSWTLARPPTLAWLTTATRSFRRGDRFSLLDVGYGQGDMLRRIHRWAIRRHLRPELVGIDLSPWSAPSARAATPPDMAIDYRSGDVFDLPADYRVHFVISSLVAHHMNDDQLVRFLRWMEATAHRGWFINDLHRHAVAYHGFRLLSGAMRWHRFVRHDGPLSVARAFRRSDWWRLIGRAGLDPATIEMKWHMPFRLCVGRLK